MRALWMLPAWILVAATPLISTAQTTTPATRAEALRQEREQKQQNLRPNQPDAIQRVMNYIEDPPRFLVARDGFRPILGRLATGSGFAFGLGYRNHSVFARHGYLDLGAAGTAKKYWGIESRVLFPDLAEGRVMVEGVAGLREYPQESFFGLGPDSDRNDRTTFLLRTSQISGRAGVRLAPVVMVGGGVAYLSPNTGEGKDDRFPPIPDLFAPPDVPGYATNVDFVRSSGFVEVDYREPLNARRGGFYRLELSRYSDRDGGAFSFRRTDIDLQQFIGFFADRRVIALRGYFSTSEESDDSEVPFYLMPTLGGNDTLRGFRNYRFRGPHALLLQAEYRWELWSGLDAAFFYDTGKVGLRRSDLGLNGLQSDYGFGFRFNTSNGVVMRVDAAFGSRDGKHLHIVFGGVF
jgi:hypothetical protein